MAGKGLWTNRNQEKIMQESERNVDVDRMQKDMDKAPSADTEADNTVKHGNDFLHRKLPKLFP